MPADFTACQKNGGNMWTQELSDGKYQHMCTLNGVTHAGEVKHKKAEGNVMETQPVQALAAKDFTECTIKSDGTLKGTTITVNGKAVPNLCSFSFSFWNDDYGPPVSISYSTCDKEKAQPGQVVQTSWFSVVPPDSQKAVASIQQEHGPVPINMLARNTAFKDIYKTI